ncbi:hypothetical protein D3C78_1095580 [compost metagenome]
MSIAEFKLTTLPICSPIWSAISTPFSASVARLVAPIAISLVAAAISPALRDVSLEATDRFSAVTRSSSADWLVRSTRADICSIILLKLIPKRPISSRPLNFVRTFRLPRSPSSINVHSFSRGFPITRNKNIPINSATMIANNRVPPVTYNSLSAALTKSRSGAYPITLQSTVLSCLYTTN